jgi:hypothetical protein
MPQLLRELPGPNMGTVHTPRIGFGVVADNREHEAHGAGAVGAAAPVFIHDRPGREMSLTWGLARIALISGMSG